MVVESVGGFIIKRYQIIVDLDTQGDKLRKYYYIKFWIYV